MKSLHVPATACPTCKAPLDAVSSVEGVTDLKNGDLTVCVYCGTLLTFVITRTDFQIVKMTYEEFRSLNPYQRALLRRLQDEVHKINARKRRERH
jgi:hypothetical protein